MKSPREIAAEVAPEWTDDMEERQWLVSAIAAAIEARDAEHAAERWQPIETAPKDSTHILVWIDYSPHKGKCFDVYWADGFWWLQSGGRVEVGTPTHWQPLPLPPGEAT